MEAIDFVTIYLVLSLVKKQACSDYIMRDWKARLITNICIRVCRGQLKFHQKKNVLKIYPLIIFKQILG